MDGVLDCFHLGAVISNTAVNIAVLIFMGTLDLISLAYTLRSAIGELYGTYA